MASPPVLKPTARLSPPVRSDDIAKTVTNAPRIGQEISPLGENDKRFKEMFLNAMTGATALPDDAIENYLHQRGRNAATLLVAWQMSGDSSFLKEAGTKFPTDPRVQFSLLTCNAFFDGHDKLDSFFADRGKWIDSFVQSSPDNPLANYLVASDYFRQHQTEKAIAEMATALTKNSFQDYYAVTVQDQEYRQLFLSAGSSSDEAQVKGFWTACLSGNRYLETMRNLGWDLAQAEAAYNATDDSAAAKAVARSAVALGQNVALDTGSLGNQIIGNSIQEMALKNLPPDEALDWLGQTPSVRLTELAQQKEQITNYAAAFIPAVSQSSRAELVEFVNRAQQDGDVLSTIQWLTARGRNPQ